VTCKPCPSEVCFEVVCERGQVANITSNSPEVNHFLDLVRLRRARNTWINYAHDLKVFFSVVGKLPEALTVRTSSPSCTSRITQAMPTPRSIAGLLPCPHSSANSTCSTPAASPRTLCTRCVRGVPSRTGASVCIAGSPSGCPM
jgi:hypothetical protein